MHKNKFGKLYQETNGNYKYSIKINDHNPFLFNFKYFDINVNNKTYYDKKCREKDDFFNFLSGCKKIGEFTWEQLKTDRHFHCHDIDNFEFTDDEIKNFTPMQIKLPSFKQGRLVGFIDKDLVFNVVKFDKKHIIYPDKTR